MFLLGFSYLALRLIWLNFEIRQKLTAPPKILDYLAYVFYFPSYASGPLFSFCEFQPQLKTSPVVEADHFGIFLKIIWGLSKLLVLGTCIHPLISSSLLTDGYRHGIFDFFVSLICSYLYFYLNFSGSMDVVLAASEWLGIKLPENFNQPFKALNISEFWRRWHITLGNFLRYIVFFPVQRKLVSRFPQLKLHIPAVSMGLCMLLMGLWHGFEINFFIYGGLHATGLIIHHYFAQPKLKMNKFEVATAWLLTHSFVAFSVLFFENSARELEKIWSVLVMR